MDNELFELCKEVYKTTHWNGIHEACFNSSCNHHAYYDNGKMIAPKYNSDYLLEKLSALTTTLMLRQEETLVDAWADGELLGLGKSETPLKALLKLVIALKDSGVELNA